MTRLLSQNRYAAACFLTLLLVAVLSVLYSWWHIKQSEVRYQIAKNTFQKDADSLYVSLADKEYLAENLPAFRSYLDNGALGNAEPMLWVEAFEKLRNSLSLDSFYYEISSAAPLQAGEGASVNIQMIPINFQMRLKHDEAVFQFFSELSHRIKVPYAVSQLEVARTIDRENDESKTILQATGEITWVAIVPVSNNPDKLKGT